MIVRTRGCAPLVIAFALVAWTLISLSALCTEALIVTRLGNTSCESSINFNATDWPWYGMPMSRWLYVDVVVRCCLATIFVTGACSYLARYDSMELGVQQLRHGCSTWCSYVFYVCVICYVFGMICWAGVGRTSGKLFEAACAGNPFMVKATRAFMIVRLLFIP
jgi:hypothetical protein